MDLYLIFGRLLAFVFQFYLLLLVARAFMSWIPVFNPAWRPSSSALAAICNFIYRVTDPPLRLVGRFFKPIRFGTFGVDISFIIVFLLVMVVSNLFMRLWYALGALIF